MLFICRYECSLQTIIILIYKSRNWGTERENYMSKVMTGTSVWSPKSLISVLYYVPQWFLSGTHGVIVMITSTKISPLKGLIIYLPACNSIYTPWKDEGLSQYSINAIPRWLLASKTSFSWETRLWKESSHDTHKCHLLNYDQSWKVV